MVLVSVLYPNQAGSRFDRDYYMEKHIPLVQKLLGGMGLQDVRVLRGVAGGDGGEPAYQVICLLYFASLQEFKNAVQTHGAEIFADIPNYTDLQPVLQVSEPL